MSSRVEFMRFTAGACAVTGFVALVVRQNPDWGVPISLIFIVLAVALYTISFFCAAKS